MIRLLGISTLIATVSISAHDQCGSGCRRIESNQSAFFLPNSGNIQDGENPFTSESYLNEHKIAVHEVIIPYKDTPNGHEYAKDYGKLVIVDQSPATKADSFFCKRADLMNVEIGGYASVSITNDNAARYLMGVGTQIIENDPPTYYARSLSSVLSDVVFNKIQFEVCKMISERVPGKQDYDYATKIRNFMYSIGITLDVLNISENY